MEGMRGIERPPHQAATLSAVGKSNLVMQDCELYGRILGIAAPWRVERVELQLKQGEVHVHLAHENNLEWPCAECGASCALYDHQAEMSMAMK